MLPYLAWQIPAVEHEDGFDVMVEQETDVLHHVLDVHICRLSLTQQLRAAKGPFVEETVHIDCERLAWRI